LIATACLFIAAALLSAGQALPPPRDGEIRALYRELQNQTEIWLTIEPRSSEGTPAPAGMILTFSSRFAGKKPKAPPENVYVRAYAGMMWAPRVEFWLLLDDRDRIDLVPPGTFALETGSVSDYLSATMNVRPFAAITKAERISGNALGFEFETTEAQREALRLFMERILSENPAKNDR
jgi:hypothetical protein